MKNVIEIPKTQVIMAFVAFMTVTASQAQGNFGQGNGERREIDRTEMTKRRTDDAVKKYSLNEDQAAKLLRMEAV